MRATIPVLALLLLGAGCAAPAPRYGAAAPTLGDDEVDRVALAAVLVRDGHFERAGVVLAEVDPRQEGLDLGRFHTLRGLVALERRDHAAAREALSAATVTGTVEPIVFVYLAQACHALDDPAGALAALERSRGAWDGLIGVHRLRVLACWKLGDRALTFGALADAERRFPEDADFVKQRVLYLLELALHQEAASAGREYLDLAGRSAAAHLALGEALRRARRPDEAAEVLEAGRLRHPGHAPILVALAHAHLDARRPRSAGVVLEEAARLDAKYLTEAAELHRRAGAVDRALFLNGQVADQPAKTRQRLGLLLQRASFDLAAALEPRLSRHGLLADEEVRYALAYAFFRAGDPERADEQLRGITRPELFRAATDLRKAIELERDDAADRK